jgi:hypothetical protein
MTRSQSSGWYPESRFSLIALVSYHSSLLPLLRRMLGKVEGYRSRDKMRVLLME